MLARSAIQPAKKDQKHVTLCPMRRDVQLEEEQKMCILPHIFDDQYTVISA